MKLWGGRFEEGPSEVFERFGRSVHFDGRLIDCDIRGSQAFARALERVGILSAAEREALVSALESIRVDARDPKFLDGVTDEDEQICESTSSQDIELCDIFNLPAGNYWIVVQNWTGNLPAGRQGRQG